MSDRRLRFKDGDFQLRCEYCREYWPLTVEFWKPKHGTRRCKGCWAEYARHWQARFQQEPGVRTVTRFKNAMYYQANRERLRAHNRAWKARNPEYTRAYNAAYRARKKAA